MSLETGNLGRRYLEQRIDDHQDYALSDWAHRLESTPQEVMQALLQVGDLAADVATYLMKRRGELRA